MKTPSKGPWIRDGYIVRQPGGRIIADVGPHHTPPDQYPLACKLEDEANGDAIAALPELVEALKMYEAAHDLLFSHCLSNGIFNRWGNSMDCTLINEAHSKSNRLLVRFKS